MIDSKDYQMSFIDVCKYLNDIVRKNNAFNCGKIEYTRVLGSDNSAALRCLEHPVGSRGKSTVLNNSKYLNYFLDICYYYVDKI